MGKSASPVLLVWTSNDTESHRDAATQTQNEIRGPRDTKLQTHKDTETERAGSKLAK